MKTVTIQAHCRDAFSLKIDDGEWHQGYVPIPFAREDDSDDVVLKIDMNTGKILNWNKEIIKQQILEFIKGE